MGNGKRTKFWVDTWCGENTLKQDFPDLFGMAVDPNSWVASNFLVNKGAAIWSPIFRRALFNWEIPRVL